MCEFCEPSKHGICKPIATTKIGFKTPLLGMVKDEDTGKLELNVYYDGEEPLRVRPYYCMICGAPLNKSQDVDDTNVLSKDFVRGLINQTEDTEVPGYYTFLETKFGFTFDGCYYTKKFRDGVLMAEYYPFEHSYRIYALDNGEIKETVMIVPCRTKSDICYALRHYYEDVINTF